MPRAFLSHSSYDKESYVRYIADSLGRDRCVFDECCFETGMKNIDEIFKGLDGSDIFVFFISEKSLNSNWVKTELINAKEKLNYFSSKILQIMPIIIDENITHKCPDIPEFLKTGGSSYNLRNIKNNRIALKKIETQLLRISMQNDSRIDKKVNFHYGRTIDIKKFTTRYDDTSRSSPKCMIVNGIEGIGRKTYIRKCLIDAGVIENYYSPSIISLQKDDSIEDLIVKISQLGFGNYTISEIQTLTNIEKKIEIVVDLLSTIQQLKEYLIIYDNGCLINNQQELNWWFKRSIDKIKSEITIGIVSSNKVDPFKYRNDDSLFIHSISELDSTERLGLLREYAKMENLILDRDDIDYLKGSLTGYPPQIHYVVDIIKSENIDMVKKRPDKISEFSMQKATEILKAAEEYVGINLKEPLYGFLSFLTKLDCVPMRIINDVIELNPSYYEIYNKLCTLCICRRIGSTNDILKTSDIIEDYIQRSRIDIPKDIEEYLTNSLNSFNSNIDDSRSEEIIDLSELNYYIKENLIRNSEKINTIPLRFIYPSVILKTIIELYNKQKVKEVIEILDELFTKTDLTNCVEYIRNEIYFYFCQSLAKDRNDRFFTEVEYFNRGSIVREFLFGCYYRHNFSYDKALDAFNNVLEKDPNYYRASREKVIVLSNLERYPEALSLARDNYLKNSDNSFQIQAYFDCLIREPNFEKNKPILDELLTNMKNQYSEKSKSLYFQMLGMYYAYVEKDLLKAIKTLNEAEKKYNNIYLLRTLFDIYEKDKNIQGMKETLEKLNQLVNDGRLGFLPMIIRRNAIIDAFEGKSFTLIEIEINRNQNISDLTKKNILRKIESICIAKA